MRKVLKRKSAFPVSLQLSSPQNPQMEKLAADMAHDRNKASKQKKISTIKIFDFGYYVE